MDIDFANLQLQYKNKAEINKQIEIVLNKSNYILGEEVFELEKNLKNLPMQKTSSVVPLELTLFCLLLSIDLHPGDEVITTPFTWVSFRNYCNIKSKACIC